MKCRSSLTEGQRCCPEGLEKQGHSKHTNKNGLPLKRFGGTQLMRDLHRIRMRELSDPNPRARRYHLVFKLHCSLVQQDKMTRSTSGRTGNPNKSCEPICSNAACSNPRLCYLLSDERSSIFPTPPPFPPPLLTRSHKELQWSQTTAPTSPSGTCLLNVSCS